MPGRDPQRQGLGARGADHLDADRPAIDRPARVRRGRLTPAVGVDVKSVPMRSSGYGFGHRSG
jgi:hypothetical protein